MAHTVKNADPSVNEIHTASNTVSHPIDDHHRQKYISFAVFQID